ncbi:MAG: OPT/YSL family transporter [Elusimicrobiales bacterium]|nr:OPT/YSL family transporter [Elusimicrobiales bacterium]
MSTAQTDPAAPAGTQQTAVQPQNDKFSGEKFACLTEAEQNWYKNVYQGDNAPQLTLRAVLMGAVLGGFMSLSNLYVGLKTGWALGVAITACILSFSLNKMLMALFPRWFTTEMSMLENNCMQTTASSAGYSTGGTMVSAISALLIITGTQLHWFTLTLWTIFLAALGVFMTIPMKRQMINVEQLRFPSGIAAAETLRSLHSKGGDAIKKARLLGLGGLIGGVIAWLRDAGIPRWPLSLKFPLDLMKMPDKMPLAPFTLGGRPLADWTISFDMSAIMIAAGAIMGWKIAWSLLLGAVINYALLAPKMVALGAIDSTHLGYSAIVRWSTWAGASMMVTSGLLLFGMQWKTVLRAFSGLSSILGKKKDCDEYDPIAHVEVPGSWFVTGVLVSGLGCILVLHYAFNTSLFMGVIAVAMSFFLAIVACRATGESDITPMGAMGKITQLTFGALAPSNMVTNLMTASVTANAASSSADLLTSLKTGYLLGANTRKLFWSQFAGIFAGTLIVVPAFYLLVPNAAALGTDKWPAPSAQVWAAVARLLSAGVHSLHPTALAGMCVGGALGIILPLLEMRLSEKHRKFVPSATGLGLSMVIPFYNSLSMFIGALAARTIERRNKEAADMYIIPLASGLIAGESILGVMIALLISLKIFN